MELGRLITDSPVISCASCKACCCRLEVMLMGDDDIPPELTEQDQWGGWVMARPGDGWCSALDRNTMLCTIYERRPMICRDYQVGDSDCIGERLQLRVSPPPARPVSPDRGSNGIVFLSDANSQPQIPVILRD